MYLSKPICITGSENGEMATPMMGTVSPTLALSPRKASNTRVRLGASCTDGGVSASMSSGRRMMGGPHSGGPSGR